MQERQPPRLRGAGRDGRLTSRLIYRLICTGAGLHQDPVTASYHYILNERLHERTHACNKVRVAHGVKSARGPLTSAFWPAPFDQRPLTSAL